MHASATASQFSILFDSDVQSQAGRGPRLVALGFMAGLVASAVTSGGPTHAATATPPLLHDGLVAASHWLHACAPPM